MIYSNIPPCPGDPRNFTLYKGKNGDYRWQAKRGTYTPVKLNSSLEQSKARLELEQANAIPDPRLSVGVRDFRDSGDQAFIVGVSLPIPVFNANRGNIEELLA